MTVNTMNLENLDNLISTAGLNLGLGFVEWVRVSEKLDLNLGKGRQRGSIVRGR